MKRDPGERAGCVEAWAHNHRDAAWRSLRRRLMAPGQSILMVAVLGLVLALPTYLWVILDDLRGVTAELDHQPRIALYLDGLVASEVEAIAAELGQMADVRTVSAQTAEQALRQYRGQLPDPGLLDWLDDNPLPAAFDILPLVQEPLQVRALSARVQTRYPQGTVISDDVWVQQVHALHQAGVRILLVLAALLGLGIVFTLAIATTAELNERQEELAIAQMMGATDRFLRRPSLYSGFWIGLGGGMVAALLLYLGLQSSAAAIEQAALTLGVDLQITGPDWRLGISVLLSGLALAWLGARIGSALALRRTWG